MKSFTKVALASIAVAGLLAGIVACGSPTDPTPSPSPSPSPTPTPSSNTTAIASTDKVLFDFESGVQGWLAAAGANGMSGAAAAAGTDVDARQGGTGSLKMTFGATAGFGTSEFYVPVTNADLVGYSGIRFDFKTPYQENFFVLLRQGGGAPNTYSEDIYSYVDKWDEGWVTFDIPFSDFSLAGWSSGHATLAEAITAGVIDQLNININLNNGDSEAGESLNTLYDLYIDNVRLYQ